MATIDYVPTNNPSSDKINKPTLPIGSYEGIITEAKWVRFKDQNEKILIKIIITKPEQYYGMSYNWMFDVYSTASNRGQKDCAKWQGFENELLGGASKIEFEPARNSRDVSSFPVKSLKSILFTKMSLTLSQQSLSNGVTYIKSDIHVWRDGNSPKAEEQKSSPKATVMVDDDIPF